LTRKELEDFVEGEGLSEHVLIPADGEGIEFQDSGPIRL
jgi:hypothetical protein